MNQFENLSKEISYALRHAPWEYELEMDEESEKKRHEIKDGKSDELIETRKICLCWHQTPYSLR